MYCRFLKARRTRMRCSSLWSRRIRSFTSGSKFRDASSNSQVDSPHGRLILTMQLVDMPCEKLSKFRKTMMMLQACEETSAKRRGPLFLSTNSWTANIPTHLAPMDLLRCVLLPPIDVPSRDSCCTRESGITNRNNSVELQER